MKKKPMFNFPFKNIYFSTKFPKPRFRVPDPTLDVILKSTTTLATTGFVTSISTRLSISVSNGLKYLALNQMPIAILALMTTNWILAF